MDLNRYSRWVVVVCVALLITSGGALSGCNVATVEEGATAAQVPPPAPVAEDSTTLALRQRATEFGNLLERLRNLSRDEAYFELQYFLEPSPDLRDRVIAYFRDFTIALKTATIRSQKVTTIDMDPNGVSAVVTYEIVFDMAMAKAIGEESVPALQETLWKQIDGAWYRSMDEPVKSLR